MRNSLVFKVFSVTRLAKSWWQSADLCLGQGPGTGNEKVNLLATESEEMQRTTFKRIVDIRFGPRVQPASSRQSHGFQAFRRSRSLETEPEESELAKR